MAHHIVTAQEMLSAIKKEQSTDFSDLNELEKILANDLNTSESEYQQLIYENNLLKDIITNLSRLKIDKSQKVTEQDLPF